MMMTQEMTDAKLLHSQLPLPDAVQGNCLLDLILSLFTKIRKLAFLQCQQPQETTAGGKSKVSAESTSNTYFTDTKIHNQLKDSIHSSLNSTN